MRRKSGLILLLSCCLVAGALSGCQKKAATSETKASDIKHADELTDGIADKKKDAEGADEMLITDEKKASSSTAASGSTQKEAEAAPAEEKKDDQGAFAEKENAASSDELPELDSGEAEAGSDTAEAEQEETAKAESGNTSVTLDVSKPLTGIHHARLTIQDYGVIELELDAGAAPLTVTNFVKLAQEGFYDGLTFHRIIKGFMMQGGDPLGNGTGGSDEKIKGEFAENGVDNPLSHTAGTISMARSRSFDSASSQFFIMHKDSTSLDRQYAAFGHVCNTEGMDVVNKVCEDAEPTDNNGTIPKDRQPVIESIIVLD